MLGATRVENDALECTPRDKDLRLQHGRGTNYEHTAVPE